MKDKQTVKRMRELLQSFDKEMVSLGALLLERTYHRRSWKRILDRYIQKYSWNYEIKNKQITIKEFDYNTIWSSIGWGASTYGTTGNYNTAIGLSGYSFNVVYITNSTYNFNITHGTTTSDVNIAPYYPTQTVYLTNVTTSNASG